MSAGWALQEAVFSALSTDATLQTFLGGANVFDGAPRNAAAPYVHLGEMSARDWSTATEAGAEVNFAVVSWSRTPGRAEGLAVADRVAALLHDAPPRETLEAAIAANPDDLRARHLLGVRHLVEGSSEAGLEQFIEMLRRDRNHDDGLPRKALIDAFRILDDAELVSTYRRKMSSLLF
jgi:thioredoxin-like negative regulator of GroEL